MRKLLQKFAEWQRRRRLVALTAAAFAAMPLAACDTSTSLAQIATTIQATCNFVVSYESVIPIVVSLVSSFDATAGAAATVATSVATQVIQEVCGAVTVAQAQGAAPAAPAADARVGAAPPSLTVVVNGVPITGTLVSTPVSRAKK